MQFTEEKLKECLNELYSELKNGKTNPRKVLAKAVTLGMKFQENKIKLGIDYVFDNLNLSM